MYDVNYSYKESLSDKKEKRETIIKIKFRFKQEVAPKDRKEIRNRIKYKKSQRDSAKNHSNIVNYLEGKEIKPKYDSENFRGGYDMTHFEKYLDNALAEIYVKSLPNELGVNLNIKVNGKYSLEEVLNPKELNTFILTGESE